MVYESIFVALAVALFGVVIADIFQIKNRNKEKKDEINKIKELLSDDYSRLYSNLKLGISDYEELVKNQTKIQEYVDELLKKKYDSSTLISKYHYPIEMNFWNAIMANGSLIKLKLEEIKYVENNYQYIVSLNSLIQQSYEKWQSNFLNMISLNRELSSTEWNELRDSFMYYMKNVNDNSSDIRKIIKETSKKFDWIKL